MLSLFIVFCRRLSLRNLKWNDPHRFEFTKPFRALSIKLIASRPPPLYRARGGPCPPLMLFVTHHHGQGYPQSDGPINGTGVHTGIAVPALLRIGHCGNLFFLGTEEHIFRAHVDALTALCAMVLIYNRWHNHRLLSFLIAIP